MIVPEHGWVCTGKITTQLWRWNPHSSDRWWFGNGEQSTLRKGLPCTRLAQQRRCLLI